MTLSMDELNKRIEEYISYCEELFKSANPFAGVFGFSGGPKEDKGHREFYDDVGIMTDRVLNEGEQEKISQMAEALLFSVSSAEKEHPAYWMIRAINGHALKLIPELAPERKNELLKRFSATFPKNKRLPIEEQLVKALKNR